MGVSVGAAERMKLAGDGRSDSESFGLCGSSLPLKLGQF